MRPDATILTTIALVLAFAAAGAWPVVLLEALGVESSAPAARRRLALRAALLLLACGGAVAAWSASTDVPVRAARG